MTPESLVLQPKVTEVRWTEQTGPWTWGAPRSHAHGRADFSWLVSILHPSGLPSDESTCLLCLLICGADTLKWRHRGLTNTPYIHVGVYKHFRPLLPPISEQHPLPDYLQSRIWFTNCCSESVPLHIAVIRANLPVASVSVFFSLFLSADSHWHTEN